LGVHRALLGCICSSELQRHTRRGRALFDIYRALLGSCKSKGRNDEFFWVQLGLFWVQLGLIWVVYAFVGRQVDMVELHLT